METVIAGLSLMVAAVGTGLAYRKASKSEEIAREALDDARRARTDALWSSAIEAVQRMYAVDPGAQDVSEPLRNLRVSLTALVDGLPTWKSFDHWIGSEHVLGAAYGREALERVHPQQTPDERLAVLDPSMKWAIALTINLRRFRATGYDAGKINQLAGIAQHQLRSLYRRHPTWGDPPGPLDGIRPLD